MARGNMKTARMNKNITKADFVIDNIKAGKSVILQNPNIICRLDPNNDEYMLFTTFFKGMEKTLQVLIPIVRETPLMILGLDTTLINVL